MSIKPKIALLFLSSIVLSEIYMIRFNILDILEKFVFIELLKNKSINILLLSILVLTGKFLKK